MLIILSIGYTYIGWLFAMDYIYTCFHPDIDDLFIAILLLLFWPIALYGILFGD